MYTEPMDPVVKDNIHGNESFRVNIEPSLSTGHDFIWYTLFLVSAITCKTDL